MMSLIPAALSHSLMKISVLIVPRMSNNRREKAMVILPRKQGRKPYGSARRSTVTDPALILRPEYKGQPLYVSKVESAPFVLTNAATSGLGSLTQAITATFIPSFGTRFDLFDEYRVIKATVRVRCFSSVAPGLGVMWFDDDASSPPSSTDAQRNKALRFNWSDTCNDHVLSWTPHDPSEQLFNPIATAYSPTNFKLFTDNLNYGAPIVATQLCSVSTELTVQFRGYA